MVTHQIDIITFTSFEILTQFGGSFTLNIPFLCQKCGQCCKEISFPDPKSFNSLIEFFKIDIQLLGKQFINNHEKKDYSKLITELCQVKPCVFLQEDLCRIYSRRPQLCREWYPRIRSKCPAYHLHNEMSHVLLYNRKYRIGIREMIFIGNENPNSSYPSVNKLKEIDEHTLIHYYFPPEDEIPQMWEIFLSFNPTKHERLIFQTINPAMRFVNSLIH
ncbi:MAG: YkgJ family cysteine cluster protein [Candidatus Thorarchaeota archaeon]